MLSDVKPVGAIQEGISILIQAYFSTNEGDACILLSLSQLGR